jgi:hypothetical protein
LFDLKIASLRARVNARRLARKSRRFFAKWSFPGHLTQAAAGVRKKFEPDFCAIAHIGTSAALPDNIESLMSLAGIAFLDCLRQEPVLRKTAARSGWPAVPTETEASSLVSFQSKSPGSEFEVNSNHPWRRKMKYLHEDGVAQLRAFGRCAMVGTLIGLMTTQAFAAGAPAMPSQRGALPETTAVANTAASQSIETSPIANLPLAAAESTHYDATALPEEPIVQYESASVKMPADLKAMMDDAAQTSQNLQSTSSTSDKKIQRPGMLVLGIAGVPLAVLGVMILSLSVGPKETGAKDGLGAAFLAPGAVMMGTGFYFAFHKKNQ